MVPDENKKSGIPPVSGTQLAAILPLSMGGGAWIGELLRWTVFHGKVPGSYMADWLGVAFFICLVGSPLVTFVLGLIIALDRRERFTPGFLTALAIGGSPVFLLIAYLIVLG